MSDIIKHRGIVENICDSHIKVRITQSSSCSSCSIKSHCTSSESKDKLIDIYDVDSSKYVIGQHVNVLATVSMGFYAVFLAFILPFILLIFSLFIFMTLTADNELLSAIFSLSMLLPYYFFIYFFRRKINKKLLFKIESPDINN